MPGKVAFVEWVRGLVDGLGSRVGVLEEQYSDLAARVSALDGQQAQNVPPAVSASVPAQVTERTARTFAATVSDPDGTIQGVQFEMVQPGGGVVDLGGTLDSGQSSINTQRWVSASYTFATLGVHTLRVTAVDDDGATRVVTYDVEAVTEAAAPVVRPSGVAISPSSFTVDEDESRTFTFTNEGGAVATINAVDDLGDQVTVQYTQGSNSFTVPGWPNDGQRTFTFTFTNTGGSAQVQAQATVNAAAATAPNVTSATPRQQGVEIDESVIVDFVNAGGPITSITASDADGPITAAWTQGNTFVTLSGFNAVGNDTQTIRLDGEQGTFDTIQVQVSIAADSGAGSGDPVSAPTNAQATAGDGQNTVAWTEAPEAALTETIVYAGPTAGDLVEVARVAAGTEQYVDAAAENGVERFYQLASTDGTFVSARTAVVSATPQNASAGTQAGQHATRVSSEGDASTVDSGELQTALSNVEPSALELFLLHESGYGLDTGADVAEWFDASGNNRDLVKTATIYDRFGDPGRVQRLAAGAQFYPGAAMDLNTNPFPTVANRPMAMWLAVEFPAPDETYTSRANMDADLDHLPDTVAYVNSSRILATAKGTDLVTDRMVSGIADADLERGYYKKIGDRNAGSWVPLKGDIFALQGGGTLDININYRGELAAFMLGFVDTTWSLRGTRDVMGTTVVLGVTFDGERAAFYVNGTETHAYATQTFDLSGVTGVYLNGDNRPTNTLAAQGDLKFQMRGLAVVEMPTWNYQRARAVHDALATRAGAPLMRSRGVLNVHLVSGQSWADHTTENDDPWVDANGWDGNTSAERTTEPTANPRFVSRDQFPGHLAVARDTLQQVRPWHVSINQLGGASQPIPEGEALTWGFHRWLAAEAPTEDWVYVLGANGGAPMSTLLDDASPPKDKTTLLSENPGDLNFYENLLRRLAVAHRYAQRNGYTRAAVRCFSWMHGHSDAGNENYAAEFIANYDRIIADIQTITGQDVGGADKVICMLDQTNYSDDGVRNRDNTVLDTSPGGVIDTEKIEIIKTRGNRPIYLTGPHYAHTNHIHPNERGIRYFSEMQARAFLAARDNGSWEPVRPQSVTVSGANIDIEFFVPTEPLQFSTNDANVLSLITHRGFDFEDADAGGVTIQSVSLLNATTVRVTLSAPPASGDSIGYARSSRFGNLCDSDTATGYYRDNDYTGTVQADDSRINAEGDLNDLRNWCVAFIHTLP